LKRQKKNRHRSELLETNITTNDSIAFIQKHRNWINELLGEWFNTGWLPLLHWIKRKSVFLSETSTKHHQFYHEFHESQQIELQLFQIPLTTEQHRMNQTPKENNSNTNRNHAYLFFFFFFFFFSKKGFIIGKKNLFFFNQNFKKKY